MTAFEDLTEIGRARRLRPLAFAALEQYDLEVARLRLITNSWNCVYRVDTTDGRKFVLRVTLPRPERRPLAVAGEAAFMQAVAEQTSVPVPVPIANRRGELVTVAGADGVPQARDCVLYSWVSGVALGSRASGETYRLLGAAHAQLHEFARSWTPPEWYDAPAYDRTLHLGEPVVLFDDRAQQHMTAEHRAGLPGLLEWCDANVRVAHERGPVIVTHGDLHQWNAMVGRGRLTVIDFEDHQWSAPILDVSTSLYYVRWADNYPELFDGYREGYTSVAPWVETHEGELDRLVPGRGLDLLNVVIDDPELDADLDQLCDRILGRCLALQQECM